MTEMSTYYHAWLLAQANMDQAFLILTGLAVGIAIAWRMLNTYRFYLLIFLAVVLYDFTKQLAEM